MNSVHEPGPNGDSETLPSRKTRLKTNPGARAPKLAQLGTPRHAHAWPYRGQAWPCRGRGPLPYRSPSRRFAAPLRAVPRTPACLALRSCASCRACRRPPWPYREHTSCRIVGVWCARTWPCRGLGRNTALPSAPFQLQYSSLYCATIFASQAFSPSPAIQFSKLY